MFTHNRSKSSILVQVFCATGCLISGSLTCQLRKKKHMVQLLSYLLLHYDLVTKTGLDRCTFSNSQVGNFLNAWLVLYYRGGWYVLWFSGSLKECLHGMWFHYSKSNKKITLSVFDVFLASHYLGGVCVAADRRIKKFACCKT